MAYRGPCHTSTRENPFLSTANAMFTTVDALFFTVATMFTMPAGGVRPPPLFLYGCSRAQSDAHVTPSAVAGP
jgi:hypothetical protein